jgi:flagellar hook-associated protein 2
MTKEKKAHPDRMETKKYCKFCKSHTLHKDGTISTNKEVLSKAADDNQLSKVFESLNSFKDSIKTKAENIALNPMDYVNNKIIAYKNPTRTYNDPYNLSAYTGMMFNGYI